MIENLRIDIDSDGRDFSFSTDLIIAKRCENDKEMQILALSLWGKKSELNRLINKKHGMTGYLSGHPTYDAKTTFVINKFDSFERKDANGKRKYHRATLVRKKDVIIDETTESFPIVMIPKTEAAHLQTIIFEYVRDNIVSGLFPDVRIPQVLAGDLFISVEEAEKVLENVNKGLIITEDEKDAAEAIKMYYRWADYIVQELAKRNRLHSLEVIACPEDILAYELIINEQEIREIVSRGIKAGWINIANSIKLYNGYSKFDDYMPPYSPTFKKVIEEIAQAEHYYGDLRPETEKFLKRIGRAPIGVQIDVVEAGIKSVQKQNRVIIVGQPGVGKTYMMDSIAFIDSLYEGKTMKTLVFSPDHLVESAWQNETELTLPEAVHHHIETIDDLIRYEKAGFLTDNQHRVFILGQNKAKNGYSNMPMAIWENKILPDEDKENKYYFSKVFACPECGEVITKRIKNPNEDDPEAEKFIEVPVDIDHFRTERYNNRKCKHCRTVLWGPSNKNGSVFSEYISGKRKENKYAFLYTSAGFLPKDEESLRILIEETVKKYNQKPSKIKKARIKDLRLAEMEIQAIKGEKKQVSPHKVSIADYIFKKLKNKFTHLIIDEMHEVQNSGTSRTEAVGKLIASVPKVIAGTGTLMNGYASSLFYIFFMLFPEVMKEQGYEITDSQKFQVDYGVTEKRWRLTEDGNRKVIAPKRKPGISPIIFPKFLQHTTVFVDKKDLKMGMGDLLTKPEPVPLSPELAEGKKELELAVAEATNGDVGLFKALIPTLYSYLDMPTVPKDVKDEDGNIIYTTKVISNLEDHKLERLKSIVKYEVEHQHNRVLVYTYYTSDGINKYLKEKLEDEGYRVSVLNKDGEKSISCDGSTKKVAKKKRESWIRSEVLKGSEVTITNPELVKTGMNLIDFAPIVRYQMDYKVYTERQARERTQRIGQIKDCNIYYIYYEDSFQEEITKLMATKIVASEAIEGHMDSQGLDAISNTRTPEEELAKKFFQHMNLK